MTLPLSDTLRAYNLVNVAKGFGFRLVKPQDPIGRWWQRASRWYSALGGSLDLFNTRFPSGAADVRANVERICRIPRMSTPAIGALINSGVAELRDGESYVNVGVWNGFTFLSGIVGNPRKSCIGVDNFSQFGSPHNEFMERFGQFRTTHHEFYRIEYQEYFANIHRDPIGFYLYDGEHSYQNQLDGLRSAEPYFAPGCIIMIDDTNDPEPRAATLEFIKSSGSRYEVVLDVKTCQNQHPTWWNGVMLLRFSS